MTKTVEEVRRAAFEAAIDMPPDASWCDQSKKYIGKNFWLADYAWQAFNAALDAVEIQLPEAKWSGDIGDQVMIADCVIAAIEQNSLGLRVK